MARISSYPKDSTIQDKDAWIGTESTNRATRNFTAEDVANYVVTSTSGVTGSGTTNNLPLWSDGPSGVLGDSQLLQEVNSNGLYKMTFNNANTFVINKPSSVTSFDPDFMIRQDNVAKVSMGWDDDGAGFGFLYNWAGDGWRFGSQGNNPELTIVTTAGSEGVTIANDLFINRNTTTSGDLYIENGLKDGDGTYGTAGQVLSTSGVGENVKWVDSTDVVSGSVAILIPYSTTATPGGSETYNELNNIVEIGWSGGNGTYVINLPSAATIPYRVIRFVTDGTYPGGGGHKVRFTAAGTETIDGAAFFEISKTYEGLSVWSTGTEWVVIQAKAH